jgi:hypothetical protein
MDQAQSPSGIQNKKTALKRPSEESTKYQGQPVGAKHSSRIKFTKGETKDRVLYGAPKHERRIPKGPPKQMMTSKSPEKEIVSSSSSQNRKTTKQFENRMHNSKKSSQTKEAKRHSNIQQSMNTKHCKIPSKTKTIKQNSKKAHKLGTKTNIIPVVSKRENSPPKYSPILYSQKFYPISWGLSKIHGIAISNDSLVWVNHEFKNCVHLVNRPGEVLRTVHLPYSPAFNCCTPLGDLLVTHSYCSGSKPVITLVTRDGKSRVLADLSSHATQLCGIVCQNEAIFVIGHHMHAEDYDECVTRCFIIQLNMSGEVKGVYKTEKDHDNIIKLISLNGQIIAIRTHDFAMLPLEDGIISSEKINKVCIQNAYSVSASVDNLGNVIVASDGDLFVIHPGLESMHKIDTDIKGCITSIAVDKTNQLWLGTKPGKLYSAKYLK